MSGPPTPFGHLRHLVHDPKMGHLLAAAEKRPRGELIRVADGRYATRAHNDGTLHTVFSAPCHRLENGLAMAKGGCAAAFKLGVYRVNERVCREPVLVDEARRLVMFRGFIDHKGALINYRLTDGTLRKSLFAEPQTWSFLETFKIENGEAGGSRLHWLTLPPGLALEPQMPWIHAQPAGRQS